MLLVVVRDLIVKTLVSPRPPPGGLPLAFNMRAMLHVFAGEFTEATCLVARLESVSQAIGISAALYSALALAIFQGREAEAAELIATATKDAERRGEGAWLPFVR